MSRNAREEGLSRRHRFAERGAFGPVLRGPRKIKGRLAVLHAVAARGPESRLGIALTRRLVPTSLERNRVKRIVREAFRRHGVKHAGYDCVITLRGKLAAADLPVLRSEIVTLFDRLAGEGAR